MKGESACVPNPCDNGGTCIKWSDSFTCTCASGYNGVNCENGKKQRCCVQSELWYIFKMGTYIRFDIKSNRTCMCKRVNHTIVLQKKFFK